MIAAPGKRAERQKRDAVQQRIGADEVFAFRCEPSPLNSVLAGHETVIEFRADPYRLEVAGEATYSPGSMDNASSYAAELLLEPNYYASSTYGIRCLIGEELRSTLAVVASGGATGVYSSSCVVVQDRCFVAVGYHVVCLQLPELAVLWHVQGDMASCFGLYLAPGGTHLIVHGECSISKFTFQGRSVWEFSGRDVFSGPFSIAGDSIEAVDFQDDRYCIDVHTGAGRLVDAG